MAVLDRNRTARNADRPADVLREAARAA